MDVQIQEARNLLRRVAKGVVGIYTLPIEGDRKTSSPTRPSNLQKGTRAKDSE
jgi:hypothetical protein